MTRYALVETAWGLLAFFVGPGGLRRVFLPGSHQDELIGRVCDDGSGAVYDPRLWLSFQKKLKRYFDGCNVSFDEQIDLRDCTPFFTSVYRRCQQVRRGRVISYGALARAVGRPAAARAVGVAMSRNPCPLVVPCHRVVASDGSLRGFSASGGVSLKRRMLALEGWVGVPGTRGSAGDRQQVLGCRGG
ncbi:MAG TPA: methylated-DNA--[protein]-cysteine S-methyltransferase [Phycisphaerae bacterium]|nr:methylated-DNA--[protein]-cysteine S-methyltransferase [Phycisphaerae bacterium]